MNKLRFSGSIGGVLRQQTSSSSDAGCGSQQQQPQQSRVPGQSSQCSRHRRRCNTGSTALALYKHDGKFLVALKHFLCPHSQLFRASRSHLQDVLCDDLVRTPSTAAAAAVAGSLITSPASNMRRCAGVPATGRAGGR